MKTMFEKGTFFTEETVAKYEAVVNDIYNVPYFERIKKATRELCRKIGIKLKEEQQDVLRVKIKKLVPEAVIPVYAKDGDMGMDVTATSVEYDKKLDCFVYHTGLAFELPKGYGMLIFPRSSNRKTNSYMANHVGILDSGYRGELLLCFKYKDSVPSILSTLRSDKFIERVANNVDIRDAKALAAALIKTTNDIVSDDSELNEFMMNFAPYKVGDRIGQIVIVPYPTVKFEETDILSESERGAGGHGSTGN